MNAEASRKGREAASYAAAQIARRQQRRLALHQAAVGVLSEHPERASRALEVLDRWEARRRQDPTLISQWRHIIETREWTALLEDSEHGDRLRKGSPFAFILDAEERLAIIGQYSRKAVAERESPRRLDAVSGPNVEH